MAQSTADLPNTHGGVRTVINNNANDAETRLAKADKLRGGFADFNDSATAVTPITYVPADNWKLLTNDKSGEFTLIDYLPEGITGALYDSNEFDFSEMSIGDMINMRTDLIVTTSSPNQEVETRLRVAIGTDSEFFIPFSTITYKSAEAHQLNMYNGIYIGSNDVLNSPARFEIKSDANASIVVNGWYCQLFLRGEVS